MSEPTPPPPPTQPPPPASAPPPVAPPASAAGSGEPNTLMVVLSYLYILFLIPFFVEKDPEVQWHAKHGGVLTLFEFALWIGFTIVSTVSGGILGCVLLPFQLIIFFGMLVIRVICIVKGAQGSRFELPVLTPLVAKFPSA